MEALLEEITAIVEFILGSQNSIGATIVSGLLAVITLVVVMSKVSSLLDIPVSSYGRCLLVLIINVVLILGIVAAVNVYAAPSNVDVARWLPLGLAVVLLLVLTAPSMMLIQKAKYPKAVLCIGLSLGAAAVVILLVKAIFDAIQRGDAEMNKTKKQRDALDEIMQ